MSAAPLLTNMTGFGPPGPHFIQHGAFRITLPPLWSNIAHFRSRGGQKLRFAYVPYVSYLFCIPQKRKKRKERTPNTNVGQHDAPARELAAPGAHPASKGRIL